MASATASSVYCGNFGRARLDHWRATRRECDVRAQAAAVRPRCPRRPMEVHSRRLRIQNGPKGRDVRTLKKYMYTILSLLKKRNLTPQPHTAIWRVSGSRFKAALTNQTNMVDNFWYRVRGQIRNMGTQSMNSEYVVSNMEL